MTDKGWARLARDTVESDLDEVFGESRMRYMSRGTYRVTLEIQCDSVWLERLYQWIRSEGVEGNLPRRPAPPSAQPRLPAAPVEGELLDPEPDDDDQP